ncbi:hypothetical protein ACM3E3_004285 [Escherichia coli]|nr:hypothetical protein [Escherichia coli]EJW6755805.1 hypothetical protein [Escherichia coli]
MAKVIFEFNSPESMKYQGKDASCISMNVRVVELSPEEQTGPHDALACIVESMGPEIIEKESRELLKSAQAKGLNAKGELLQFYPEAVKH